MNDEPRKVVIGMFPTGSEIVAFEDVEGELVREAARKLDEARAEAEERARQARERVTVDRQWLLEVLRDLILSMESHRKAADRRGDHARGRALWRKAWERRESYDALAKEPPA